MKLFSLITGLWLAVATGFSATVSNINFGQLPAQNVLSLSDEFPMWRGTTTNTFRVRASNIFGLFNLTLTNLPSWTNSGGDVYKASNNVYTASNRFTQNVVIYGGRLGIDTNVLGAKLTVNGDAVIATTLWASEMYEGGGRMAQSNWVFTHVGATSNGIMNLLTNRLGATSNGVLTTVTGLVNTASAATSNGVLVVVTNNINTASNALAGLIGAAGGDVYTASNNVFTGSNTFLGSVTSSNVSASDLYLSNALAVSVGGTGQTNFTVGKLLAGNGTNIVEVTLSTNLSLNTNTWTLTTTNDGSGGGSGTMTNANVASFIVTNRFQNLTHDLVYGTGGTNVTVDLSTGNNFRLNATNNFYLTFANVADGQSGHLLIVQDTQGASNTVHTSFLFNRVNVLTNGALTVNSGPSDITVFWFKSVGTNVFIQSTDPFNESVDTVALRYNAQWFGAKGDGVCIKNTTVAAGSTNVTTTEGLFRSTMVGKVISIYEVGASSNNVTTTVASFVDTNAITIAVAVGIGSTNTTCVVGTDDTAAIQAGINHVGTNGGGTLFFPKGIYVLNGPVQEAGTILPCYVSPATRDAFTRNAQLLAPGIAFNGQHSPCLRLEGVYQPTPQSVYMGTPSGYALPREFSAYGTVLWSTLTNANGASVFSGEGLANDFAGTYWLVGADAKHVLNNLKIQIEGINFRLPRDPDADGLNLRGCPAYLENVMVDTGYGLYNAPKPTHTNSFAIWLPGEFSQGQSYAHNVLTIGFYNGFGMGEHLHAGTIGAWQCMIGMNFTNAGGHINIINRFDGEACHIYMQGGDASLLPAGITVNLTSENTQIGENFVGQSAWDYPSTNDPPELIADVHSTIYGMVNYSHQAGTEIPFTLAGNTNLMVVRMPAVPTKGAPWFETKVSAPSFMIGQRTGPTWTTNYSDAPPNGSLCTTLDGQFFVRTNNQWKALLHEP